MLTAVRRAPCLFVLHIEAFMWRATDLTLGGLLVGCRRVGWNRKFTLTGQWAGQQLRTLRLYVPDRGRDDCPHTGKQIASRAKRETLHVGQGAMNTHSSACVASRDSKDCVSPKSAYVISAKLFMDRFFVLKASGPPLSIHAVELVLIHHRNLKGNAYHDACTRPSPMKALASRMPHFETCCFG
ncbi:hypothetical protein Efla_003378 [Eimeria flavescens]